MYDQFVFSFSNFIGLLTKKNTGSGQAVSIQNVYFAQENRIKLPT